MTRLMLVRHGETDWNRAARYQGQIDLPLNATGRFQAQQLARRLEDTPFAVTLTSDLRRAYETAQIVSPQPLIHPDQRLREPHYGVFQGLTHDEMALCFPEHFAAWLIDRAAVPPGGEHLRDVIRRVELFLADMLSQHRDQTVLVVSHGELIQMMLCVALNLPPERCWMFELTNVSLTELRWCGHHVTLARLNDTAHLNTAAAAD